MSDPVVINNTGARLPEGEFSLLSLGRRSPSGRSLVGIQPALAPEHFLSLTSLNARIRACLDFARVAGCITDRTVVVFPEYFGLYFCLCGAPTDVLKAGSLKAVAARLARHRPLDLLRAA